MRSFADSRTAIVGLVGWGLQRRLPAFAGVVTVDFVGTSAYLS